MTNKEISALLRQTASLLDLHDQNPEKARLYQSTVFGLEKLGISVLSLEPKEWTRNGFAAAASKILQEIKDTQTLAELHQLLEKTPEGLLDIMQLKGLGAKKVRQLWTELRIETLEQLKEAAISGKIAKTKGFGEKTQENILQEIAFLEANSLKKRYADAEKYAFWLEEYLKKSPIIQKISLSGQICRKLEVIDQIEIVLACQNTAAVFDFLKNTDELETDLAQSSPFVWRGAFAENHFPVEIKMVSEQNFVSKLFENSADEKHFQKNLLQIARSKSFENEQQIYEAAHLAYIEPELREGLFEFDLPENFELIEEKHLKGVLHCHSTYSDGKHSLEEMALAAKNLGYEYLGISDHSESAFYANGLNADRIRKQHAEIDELNKKLAPFKILKGIESDILADGSLDYENSILASFDFIVASVHSNLKMDISTATDRLLKAIANPYTTILGHPTGRLLLKREGYPIDYEAVINACANYGVVIEINANPKRLDLDWRWVNFAIRQGVKISINPDAHAIEGYQDTRFGVLVARKAALQKKDTFNAFDLPQMIDYLENRKKNIG